MATRLFALPWLYDWVNVREASVLEGYSRLAQMDADLLRNLAAKPWLLGGVSKFEADVVDEVLKIARSDAALARKVLAFPRLRYEANHDDQETIRSLARVTEGVPELERRVAIAPDIANLEFVTSRQWDVLYSLSIVANRDDELVSKSPDTSPNILSWRNRHLFGALS